MISMSNRRSGYYSLTIGIVFAFAAAAHASSVNTPPLRIGNGAAQYVCRVFNMNAASLLNPIPATITLIDYGTGATVCSQSVSFTSVSSSVELECASGFQAFCTVSVSANSIADNMVVHLFLEDSRGNALAMVRGMRVPTLVPSSVAAAG